MMFLSKVFVRLCLTILPLLYMWLIWLQSSYFNPESLATHLIIMNENLLLVLGGLLEIGHFFEFGILYMLLLIALLSYGPLTRQKETFSLIVSFGYGLLDEVHQIFVPFRSFSLFDMVKDFVGIWVVWYIIHKSYFGKKNSSLGRKLKHLTTYLNG
jgi:polysaccharide biosynthesis protein VpsQ